MIGTYDFSFTMESEDADQPTQIRMVPLTIELGANCTFVPPEVFIEGNFTVNYYVDTTEQSEIEVISFQGHSNGVCSY